MSKFLTSVCVTLMLTIVSVFAVADGHTPRMDALELISFNLKKGKDMDDVFKHAAEMDKWIASNIDTGYMAWVMVPDTVSMRDYPMDFFWLGVAKDNATMGKNRDVWWQKGAKMQKKFDALASFEGRRTMTSMSVKPLSDKPGNGVMTVWSCAYKDGQGFAEVAAGDKAMLDYMDKVGMPGGLVRWFPGAGGPKSDTADFRNVFVSASDEERGQASDLMLAGGQQALQQAYGNTVECDQPRVWRAFHVVGKSL